MCEFYEASSINAENQIILFISWIKIFLRNEMKWLMTNQNHYLSDNFVRTLKQYCIEMIGTIQNLEFGTALKSFFLFYLDGSKKYSHSNLEIRKVLIRYKLVLRNFLWITNRKSTVR